MTQYTPGPWRSEGPDHFGDFNILHPADSLAVAAVVSNMRRTSEISANARLIAAAPDMIALLRELIDIEGPQPGTAKWARKVQATIAKAEGRALPSAE